MDVAPALAGVSIVVAVAGVGIALFARHDAHRSASAAERSAVAAEQQVELTRLQVVEQVSLAQPNVAVFVLRCWHVTSDYNDSTVAVSYTVHNLSTRPTVVRDVFVEYETTTKFATDGQVRPQYTADEHRLLPIPLRADERVERSLTFAYGRRVGDDERNEAALTVVTEDVADVDHQFAVPFTIYQP